MSSTLLVLLLAPRGLPLPRARSNPGPGPPGCVSRRDLARATASLAATVGMAPRGASAYRTVQQAMEDSREVSKRSQLYARFAIVEERMGQLDEFGTLADDAKWDNIQAFARNFNKAVQQDIMLRIVDELPSDTKASAKAYADQTKEYLKAIDKAARQQDVDRVKEMTGKLRSNMASFVQLRPSQLREAYGVPDL